MLLHMASQSRYSTRHCADCAHAQNPMAPFEQVDPEVAQIPSVKHVLGRWDARSAPSQLKLLVKRTLKSLHLNQIERKERREEANLASANNLQRPKKESFQLRKVASQQIEERHRESSDIQR